MLDFLIKLLKYIEESYTDFKNWIADWNFFAWMFQMFDYVDEYIDWCYNLIEKIAGVVADFIIFFILLPSLSIFKNPSSIIDDLNIQKCVAFGFLVFSIYIYVDLKLNRIEYEQKGIYKLYKKLGILALLCLFLSIVVIGPSI